jgi:hypothetical protein
MPVGAAIVGVRRRELNIDQIQHSVADTALGNELVGELTHALDAAFEHHGLDALIVIQMRVHRRYREFVMGVLNACQSFRQFALVVIVNVGKIRNAGAACIALLGAHLQVIAQYVANRLAARRVAPLFDELVERTGQTFVE